MPNLLIIMLIDASVSLLNKINSASNLEREYKSRLFLGDNGSYLLGGLTSLNIIFSNNFNPEISSFFFCILLFYLFFEVFFSFFRKLYLNKSPLNPDSEHLHMLTYFLLKKKLAGQDCNYLNSLLINFIYIILISPSLLFINNGILCRYWFFLLLIVYLIFYLRLKEKINENNWLHYLFWRTITFSYY